MALLEYQRYASRQSALPKAARQLPLGFRPRWRSSLSGNIGTYIPALISAALQLSLWLPVYEGWPIGGIFNARHRLSPNAWPRQLSTHPRVTCSESVHAYAKGTLKAR